MSLPLISVVTPTMNPGARLARCIESLAAQTYSQFEHIVIDGGSTDGTLELLQSARDIRWVSEPDQGQSDAINKGFAQASGDYLGWLNADDVLTPWALERTVAAFRNAPNVGWTVGDVIVRDGNEAEIERPAEITKPKTWRARNLAAQPGSFISRWALEKVGGLDPTFHFSMDLDIWMRLIDTGVEHAYIPEVLAIFELHGDSKSGSVSHAEFLLEDGRARYTTGRLVDASFAYGRASAWAGASVPHSWLRDRIGDKVDELDDALVWQGFRTERALLGIKRSPLEIFAVLDPRLWGGPARSRIVHAASRRLSRSRRRKSGREVIRALEGLS